MDLFDISRNYDAPPPLITLNGHSLSFSLNTPPAKENSFVFTVTLTLADGNVITRTSETVLITL